MHITYIYRYVLPSTLKFFFFQGLGFTHTHTHTLSLSLSLSISHIPARTYRGRTLFMAGQEHTTALGRGMRSHFHRRHPDPGQGRRQRRGLGACGDERVVFCGEADLFFCMGFFFCVCVCLFTYMNVYMYMIYMNIVFVCVCVHMHIYKHIYIYIYIYIYIGV